MSRPEHWRDCLCGCVDIEISKNGDRGSTGLTLRQELTSSGKEGRGLGGGVDACGKEGEQDV